MEPAKTDSLAQMQYKAAKSYLNMSARQVVLRVVVTAGCLWGSYRLADRLPMVKKAYAQSEQVIKQYASANAQFDLAEKSLDSALYVQQFAQNNNLDNLTDIVSSYQQTYDNLKTKVDEGKEKLREIKDPIMTMEMPNYLPPTLFGLMGVLFGIITGMEAKRAHGAYRRVRELSKNDTHN